MMFRDVASGGDGFFATGNDHLSPPFPWPQFQRLIEKKRKDDRSICQNQFELEIYIPIKLVIRKTEVSNTDLCV